MKVTRREFLKLLSSSALVVCAGPSASLLFADSLASDKRQIQYGMVVDLKKCAKDEQCSDCIAACHSVHNVPEIPSKKEEIKWIWAAPYAEVFPEQKQKYLQEHTYRKLIPVLCNHCENPPCVSVCPTRATFKRSDGIVMMDYHRCIGCRYCMAACPYSARSFNWRNPRQYLSDIKSDYPTRTKGVVEKCNFCDERLRKGLEPACVNACKSKGLTFGNLSDEKSGIRKALEGRTIFRRKSELGTNPNVYYVI